MTFDEVKMQGRKNSKCACGKRVTRQHTFSQTINPFNKNKDGEIKTRQEINEELRAEIEAWKQEPVLCTACEDDD